MYRLRQMDIDDKVCEQVSMTVLSEIYPQEVIKPKGRKPSLPVSTNKSAN